MEPEIRGPVGDNNASVSSRSGGVSLDGEGASVGGDVVGRDKIVSDSGDHVGRDKTEINITRSAVLMFDRRVAIVFLVLAIIAGLAIVLIPQLNQTSWATWQSVDEDVIGIAVAEFAVGGDLRQSSSGREVSRLIYDSLEADLKTADLGQRVKLTKIPLVRSADEAKQFGHQVNADMVLWGWIPEYAPDSIVPNFTLAEEQPPLRDIKVVEPLSLMITGPNTIRLNQIVGRTTALSRFVQGLIYLKGKTQDDYQQALQMFKQGVVDLEQDTQGLSDLVSQTNDIDTKTALGDSVRALQKTQAVFRVGEGLAYAALGEAAEARGCYEVALKLNPSYGRAYSALGSYYYGEEKYADAKRAYITALDLEPQNSGALYGLGSVYFYLQEYELSLNALNKAIELTEADHGEAALAYFAKGYALKALQRPQAAAAAFHVVVASKTVDSDIRQIAQSELAELSIIIPPIFPTLNQPTKIPDSTPARRLPTTSPMPPMPTPTSPTTRNQPN